MICRFIFTYILKCLYTYISHIDWPYYFSCPKYNNIPSGCTEVKKAGDCCTTIQCSNGKFYSSTKNLGTIGNGGLINVGNSGIQPTIPTGGIAPPGTGGTNFQAPSLSKFILCVQSLYLVSL